MHLIKLKLSFFCFFLTLLNKYTLFFIGGLFLPPRVGYFFYHKNTNRVFKKNPTKTVLSIRINTNTWLLMFLITILKKGIKHAFLLTNIIHETTTSTNYLIYYILTFV